ncbi:hypothetical protein N665_0167s0018 [Sinapis alba]|nr:hypothetical protein N665_0167s0018 [Sinapis alba]
MGLLQIFGNPVGSLQNLIHKTPSSQLYTSSISSYVSLVFPRFNVSLLTYTLNLQFSLKPLTHSDCPSPFHYNQSFMCIKTKRSPQTL